MTNIHETAYPVLPAELEEAELRTVYTPVTSYPSAHPVLTDCDQISTIFRSSP